MNEPAPRRPTILFVDDEQSVLDGLAAALRRQRKLWDMEFVCGGAAALEVLEPGRFDAVVSDMRMPRTDGEAVLTAARERCPGTVRILLSGQTDAAVVLRTVRYAHRFLSKPCTSDELRDCLERLLGLACAMDTPTRELVCSVDVGLPPAPHAQLQALFASPPFEIDPIARAIEQHTTLAAKLVHVAGAGFFAPPQIVSTVRQALLLVGVETVRTLVFSMQLCEESPRAAGCLKHAVATGRLLKRITGDDSALLCGLLHGVGKLVLLERLGAPYAALLDEVEADPTLPFEQLEKARFGVGHAVVAAQLVALWGIAPPIAEAIREHSEPLLAERNSPLAVALHAACALTGGCAHLDGAQVEACGLDDRIETWRAWAAELA